MRTGLDDHRPAAGGDRDDDGDLGQRVALSQSEEDGGEEEDKRAIQITSGLGKMTHF